MRKCRYIWFKYCCARGPATCSGSWLEAVAEGDHLARRRRIGDVTSFPEMCDVSRNVRPSPISKWLRGGRRPKPWCCLCAQRTNYTASGFCAKRKNYAKRGSCAKRKNFVSSTRCLQPPGGSRGAEPPGGGVRGGEAPPAKILNSKFKFKIKIQIQNSNSKFKFNFRHSPPDRSVRFGPVGSGSSVRVGVRVRIRIRVTDPVRPPTVMKMIYGKKSTLYY